MEDIYLAEFLDLAKTCSFQESAENMCISASSLSKHIHKMETELGVPLFDRSTRTVTLSKYGELLLEYAQKIVSLTEEYKGAIQHAVHSESTAIRVGFLPMLANGTPNADAAFPTLVAKLLPAGVKGLVVCGILAALMSSLASLFNSSAMLFTIDFWKRLRPETSEKSLVRIGQIATVVIVILGILWIPIMRSVGNVLYNYLQDVQSVLAPGIAAAFLLGICWKRASAKGGMWGLLSGIIIGLTRLGAKVYYSNATDAADSWFKAVFYDFNWLFFCGVMLIVCCLVVIVVSLLTEAPDQQKIQGLVFGTSTPEQIAATRASWNKWDVFHTLVILGFTVAFYIYFW